MKKKNPIGWFEIYVSDFEKSKIFYHDLFGWEYRLLKNFRTEYWTIWTGEGTVGGGFMKKADDFKGGQSVVLYIDVDNIDEALTEVEKSGGKIVTPKTLINESSGYFGMFKDLDDNLLGLWTKH